jgi:Arm DNA-binding domain
MVTEGQEPASHLFPNFGKASTKVIFMKLTQQTIARLALPADKSDAIFFDDDLPGFGLRVRAGGKRSWIVQYRIGAKQRRLSIGDVRKVSADLARKEAKNRLARVELGFDPQQEKYDTRAAAGQTVGKLVEEYLARRHYETGKDPVRQNSYEAIALYLQRDWRPLHAVRADKVDRGAVAARVTAIEAEVSSVTAARARCAFKHVPLGGGGGDRHRQSSHRCQQAEGARGALSRADRFRIVRNLGRVRGR